MTNAVPDLSAMCARSQHGGCPHWAALRLTPPWRRQAGTQMRLCRCPCHAGCPLAGDDTVPQARWAADCTCPGAERARVSFERQFERRQEVRRLVGEVDFSDHPDAHEIESRLRAVFEEHGRPAPPGMTTWSRVVAAGVAPRGTRLPRFVGLGARAVADGVRWSHGPASSDRDADNRSQARSGYRLVGVVAGLAVSLTVGAVATSGWRRLLLGGVAAVGWLASGYGVSMLTAVAAIARSAEAYSRAQDLPTR